MVPLALESGGSLGMNRSSMAVMNALRFIRDRWTFFLVPMGGSPIMVDACIEKPDRVRTSLRCSRRGYLWIGSCVIAAGKRALFLNVLSPRLECSPEVTPYLFID